MRAWISVCRADFAGKSQDLVVAIVNEDVENSGMFAAEMSGLIAAATDQRDCKREPGQKPCE